jgi:hypothetical protein
VHRSDEPVYLCLEGAEEVADERVFAAEGQDLALDQGALDVVVIQDLETAGTNVKIFSPKNLEKYWLFILKLVSFG